MATTNTTTTTTAKYDSINLIENEPMRVFQKRRSSLEKYLFAGVFTGALVIFGSLKIYSFWQQCKIEVFQTSSNGDILSKLPQEHLSCFSGAMLGSSLSSSQLKIDRSSSHQTIIGFGGAFTEAAAITFASLPESSKQRVLDLYWGSNGAGYTIGRIAINSCDFSVASYSFDDVPGDWNLDHFDMEVKHDQETIIPFIKRAMATTRSPMKLFGSPWSPPSWLKAKVDGEESMDGSAMQGGLLSSDRARATWANYLSKWVSAYDLQGITVWGLTVQNEPEFAAPWEACKFNASTEASFVRNFLGPTLRKDHPDLKLMAFDHNKDHLETWTNVMFPTHDHPKNISAADYIDGMAFHWYAGGMDRLQDGTFGYHFIASAYEQLEKSAHQRAKEVPFLLGTEACSCSGTASPGSSLSWIRSERYAHDIINDLRNMAGGWVDWNLLLNSEGGPNHLGNLCDAPILATQDFSGILVQPYLIFLRNSDNSNEVDGFDEVAYGGPIRMMDGATLSVWPCDGSSRQRIDHDEEKLVVMAIGHQRAIGVDDRSDSHDNPEEELTLCISNANNMVAGAAAQVINCNYNEWVGRFSHRNNSGALVLINPVNENDDLCLGVQYKYASLMEKKGGAPVVLTPCAVDDDDILKKHQYWEYDTELNSYSLPSMSQQCLTIGWPFVQGVAGVTPTGETVAVLMNEASVHIAVEIHQDGGGVVNGVLPPESIQTYVFTI